MRVEIRGLFRAFEFGLFGGGGFGAGLFGEVVQDGDGKFVLVAFAGINLKIGAWLLGTDAVQERADAA